MSLEAFAICSMLLACRQALSQFAMRQKLNDMGSQMRLVGWCRRSRSHGGSRKNGRSEVGPHISELRKVRAALHDFPN